MGFSLSPTKLKQSLYPGQVTKNPEEKPSSEMICDFLLL